MLRGFLFAWVALTVYSVCYAVFRDPFVAGHWTAIICVVGPASFRSSVSLALLAWWTVSMTLWHAVGPLDADHLRSFAIALDVGGFVAVAARGRTWADLFILTLFVPTIYGHAVLPPYQDWLASWLLGMTQFLIAGWAALHTEGWADDTRQLRKFQDDMRRRVALALRGRPAWNS